MMNQSPAGTVHHEYNPEYARDISFFFTIEKKGNYSYHRFLRIGALRLERNVAIIQNPVYTVTMLLLYTIPGMHVCVYFIL